jgi:branched-chain amino acid transport system permease protein
LKLKSLLLVLIGIAAAVLLPVVFGSLKGGGYYLHLIIIMCVMSMLGISYNIIVGYTGRSNLAHAAFYGFGAYASTILVMRLGIPYWISFIAAGLLPMAVGLLIAFPTMKLQGTYFAICTLAIAQFFNMLFVNARAYTGGTDGVVDIPDLTLFGIDFHTSKLPYAWLMIFFTVVFYLVASRIVSSRMGRAFISIREGELLANTTGIDITRYKTLAFMLSAFMGGLVGALYAPYMHYVAPVDFSLAVFMTVMTNVAVGGFGTLLGPVLGSIILTALPEILLPLKDYVFIINGAILIPVIIFMPRGIMGVYNETMRRRRARALASGGN